MRRRSIGAPDRLILRVIGEPATAVAVSVVNASRDSTEALPTPVITSPGRSPARSAGDPPVTLVTSAPRATARPRRLASSGVTVAVLIPIQAV